MFSSFSKTLQALTNRPRGALQTLTNNPRTTLQVIAGGWMLNEVYKLTTNPNNVQVREEPPQNEETQSSIKSPGSSS